VCVSCMDKHVCVYYSDVWMRTWCEHACISMQDECVLFVCMHAHDKRAAYRYVILNKDFEKAYKATIKKTTDELEFYK